MTQFLIVLSLIPATFWGAFGAIQWFLKTDIEGDGDGIRYGYLFFHPQMLKHWKRAWTRPFSKAAWKNVFAEWVRLQTRIGDMEAPAKLLPFFGAVLGFALAVFIFVPIMWVIS